MSEVRSTVPGPFSVHTDYQSEKKRADRSRTASLPTIFDINIGISVENLV